MALIRLLINIRLLIRQPSKRNNSTIKATTRIIQTDSKENFKDSNKSCSNFGFQEFHQESIFSESKQESELSHNVAANGGNGARSETTTYGDWYHKVNAGQQQQAAPASAGGPSSKKRQQVPHPSEAAQNYYGPDPRMAFAQPGAEPYSVIPAPYVQYPNDPYSYYTLNGNSRVLPRGGYYAPY